jgi:hypothetical protein
MRPNAWSWIQELGMSAEREAIRNSRSRARLASTSANCPETKKEAAHAG